jgi:hypothetical protein
VLEGRQLALNDSLDAARDRWEAVAEEPGADSIPRLRAEALVRLALMAYSTKRTEDAEVLTRQLATPEILAALPLGWEKWIGELERRAPHSEHGGAPLPPPLSELERPQKPERGEHGRH